jgi:selenocysteine-specific elongation factor
MRVVATAGHVDHGKSTLVRALTGMEPDRWAEERRRGMTIDLGFAWTTLPSGEDVAFVDVPGHERFVPNMLAGVGAVPAALVVVAADEGWMPQSEEHLAALDALGVGHGLLAVTRADLADPAPATAEALERIARTSLGAVEAVAVSALTGAGLDDLRAGLDRMTSRLPAPHRDSPVRLWVDRSFVVRGAGTVVTGTLAAGTLRAGDRLELLPSGRQVTVRGLQSLQRSADLVPAVARVAVNLRGIDHDDVRRGDALCTPGVWAPVAEVDVRLDHDGVPERLVLHVGSAAVAVRTRALGAGHARMRLAAPLPLAVGDRALLRDPGRHVVAAGVTVLDVEPPPLRRRGAAVHRAVELAGRGESLETAVEVHRRGAMTVDALAAMGLPTEADGVVAAGIWRVDAERWRAWLARLPAVVDTHHADRPLEPGVPLDVVRRTLELPDRALVALLAEAAGELTVTGGTVSRRDRDPGLDAGAREAVESLRRRLAAEPFAAPEAPEVAALGLTQRHLAAAERLSLLLRVADGIVLLPDAPDIAVRRLTALPQPFTTSQARQALGTTRRVAIPLLEHLDATRRTRRVDGARRVVVARPPA